MSSLIRIFSYLLFYFCIAILFNSSCTKIQKNLPEITQVNEEKRPNILFILAEDHSAQLGVYGDIYVSTPNLDRLAEQGVRFDNAYVTQAGCSPSRASILTGLYPHQHGQIGLATHRMRLFEDDIPNIPAILKGQGYRTGNIGKIHVTPESVFRFDYHNNASYNQFRNRDIAAVANETENFILSSEKPFYLQVNFADAHLPFLPQEYGIPDKPYEPDQIGTLPFVGLRTELILQQTADYYSSMARLDSAVKLLLDVLEKTGEIQNTLVIYMSDHGAEAPRGKLTSFEGGIHVPLIMWMPGHIDGGMVRKELVSTIDLMPTILALAGAELPEGLPGRSLWPLLTNEDVTWREYLFTEFTLHWPETFFPQRTVRDERFKLIHNLLPDTINPVYQHYMTMNRSWKSGEDPYNGLPEHKRRAYDQWKHPVEFELYDLKNDRWEWNNLAEMPEYQDVLSRLRGELAKWQVETGDELRHPEKLRMLKREVQSTFVDGEYIHLRNRHDFEWQYVDYLNPLPPSQF